MQVDLTVGSEIARMKDLNARELLAATQTLEFLTFTLGCKEYGIDILKVQEIRRKSVARIANTSEFLKNAVNLRGIIVPILDVRIKLNLGMPTYNQFAVVIILNINGRVIGMVVDSVSNIANLSAVKIRQSPIFGTAFNASYLIELGAIEGRLVILVDIDIMMAHEGMNEC